MRTLGTSEYILSLPTLSIGCKKNPRAYVLLTEISRHPLLPENIKQSP